jgi:pyruvate dehydrogenase E1 component alpha subunit
MVRTRLFEERTAQLFAAGELHGTIHLAIGEEATAVGVCAALKKGDVITQTHRGHGQAIALGMDMQGMMAELFGKAGGTCGGYGGSMHIADLSCGSLGANGIVAGGIPLAVGSALSQQYFEKKRITVCFFGDGAANEGAFHESLNLAALWKLPLLLVCENNFYGMSTHIKKSMNIDDISLRGIPYGISGQQVDGNDVIAVYHAARESREQVLEKGPLFLVLNTYRWAGHSHNDRQVYRHQEEVTQWQEKCPIARLRDTLIQENRAIAAELDALDEKVKAEVDAAVQFARKSPVPDPALMASRVFAAGEVRGAKICAK